LKKVVMFSSPIHEIPPTKGAAVEKWIDEVSKRVISYQMHIISISHDFMLDREFIGGVYYHRIKIGKLYKRIFQKILGWDIYSYNKRVFGLIKKISPDIVHIHNYYGAKEIINKIRLLDKNIKIVVHMHNISNSFEARDFSEIDSFIGCSEFITNYYKNKNLVRSNDFIHIYNGVDIDLYDLVATKKIKNIFDNGDKKNIFYFGRVSKEKGVDKIVEMASIFKNNNKYNFYIVGELSNSGDRKKFLNELKEKIKIDNLKNISFLDYIAPQKIHLAYKMADIVVIPSRFEEPFCMVAIEAMASKIPIICSNKGGMKEYLVDEYNAIVIDDYENFAALAVEKIEELFLDVFKKNIIAQNGYETVKERFDWQDIAIGCEKYYNKIMKKD